MKEAVKESVPFFKTIWLALNPWRYDEAKDRGTGNILKYFFSFVFLAFVLAIILMLPAIANLVTTQMSHFKVLEVKFNTSMSSPVVFPANNPFVTIDTRKSEGDLKQGKFLITDDYLYTKNVFGGVRKDALGPYKNLTQNEGIVIAALLMLLPSLLFLFYVYYVLKVLMIVLIATLLGFVIARLVKFELTCLDALKAGLLASTPMIIIDLVKLPFNFNVYFAQYIAFLMFFIVGVIKIGEFEGSGGRSRKKGRYIDLGKKI
ncbi:DUF1189 family protein [Candidatus Woesearchaeota archaeon]|nr:DUF1189 family protein [Candidatus Woesearchaeota archaeon]